MQPSNVDEGTTKHSPSRVDTDVLAPNTSNENSNANNNNENVENTENSDNTKNLVGDGKASSVDSVVENIVQGLADEVASSVEKEMLVDKMTRYFDSQSGMADSLDVPLIDLQEPQQPVTDDHSQDITNSPEDVPVTPERTPEISKASSDGTITYDYRENGKQKSSPAKESAGKTEKERNIDTDSKTLEKIAQSGKLMIDSRKCLALKDQVSFEEGVSSNDSVSFDMENPIAMNVITREKREVNLLDEIKYEMYQSSSDSECDDVINLCGFTSDVSDVEVAMDIDDVKLVTKETDKQDIVANLKKQTPISLLCSVLCEDDSETELPMRGSSMLDAGTTTKSRIDTVSDSMTVIQDMLSGMVDHVVSLEAKESLTIHIDSTTGDVHSIVRDILDDIIMNVCSEPQVLASEGVSEYSTDDRKCSSPQEVPEISKESLALYIVKDIIDSVIDTIVPEEKGIIVHDDMSSFLEVIDGLTTMNDYLLVEHSDDEDIYHKVQSESDLVEEPTSTEHDNKMESLVGRNDKNDKETWESIVLMGGKDLIEKKVTTETPETALRDVKTSPEKEVDVKSSSDSEYNQILSALAYEDEIFSDGDQLVASYLASDEEVEWRTTDSEDSQESSFDEADFSSLGTRVVSCLWSPKPKLKSEIEVLPSEIPEDIAPQPTTPVHMEATGSATQTADKSLPLMTGSSGSPPDESDTSSSTSSDSGDSILQESSLDLDDEYLETNFPTLSNIVVDEGPKPKVLDGAGQEEGTTDLEAPEEQTLHALRNALDCVLPEKEEPETSALDETDDLVDVEGPVGTSSPRRPGSVSPDVSPNITWSENPPGSRSPSYCGFWSPPRIRSPVGSESPRSIGSDSPSYQGSASPARSRSPSVMSSVGSRGSRSPSPAAPQSSSSPEPWTSPQQQGSRSPGSRSPSSKHSSSASSRSRSVSPAGPRSPSPSHSEGSVKSRVSSRSSFSSRTGRSTTPSSRSRSPSSGKLSGTLSPQSSRSVSSTSSRSSSRSRSPEPLAKRLPVSSDEIIHAQIQSYRSAHVITKRRQVIDRRHPLIDSSAEMSDVSDRVIDSTSKMIDRESDVSDAESGPASPASVGDASPVFSPSSPAKPQDASIYWNDQDTSPHNVQQDIGKVTEKSGLNGSSPGSKQENKDSPTLPGQESLDRTQTTAGSPIKSSPSSPEPGSPVKSSPSSPEPGSPLRSSPSSPDIASPVRSYPSSPGAGSPKSSPSSPEPCTLAVRSSPTSPDAGSPLRSSPSSPDPVLQADDPFHYPSEEEPSGQSEGDSSRRLQNIVQPSVSTESVQDNQKHFMSRQPDSETNANFYEALCLSLEKVAKARAIQDQHDAVPETSGVTETPTVIEHSEEVECTIRVIDKSSEIIDKSAADIGTKGREKSFAEEVSEKLKVIESEQNKEDLEVAKANEETVQGNKKGENGNQDVCESMLGASKEISEITDAESARESPIFVPRVLPNLTGNLDLGFSDSDGDVTPGLAQHDIQITSDAANFLSNKKASTEVDTPLQEEVHKLCDYAISLIESPPVVTHQDKAKELDKDLPSEVGDENVPPKTVQSTGKGAVSPKETPETCHTAARLTNIATPQFPFAEILASQPDKDVGSQPNMGFSGVRSPVLGKLLREFTPNKSNAGSPRKSSLVNTQPLSPSRHSPNIMPATTPSPLVLSLTTSPVITSSVVQLTTTSNNVTTLATFTTITTSTTYSTPSVFVSPPPISSTLNPLSMAKLSSKLTTNGQTSQSPNSSNTINLLQHPLNKPQSGSNSTTQSQIMSRPKKSKSSSIANTQKITFSNSVNTVTPVSVNNSLVPPVNSLNSGLDTFAPNTQTLSQSTLTATCTVTQSTHTIASTDIVHSTHTVQPTNTIQSSQPNTSATITSSVKTPYVPTPYHVMEGISVLGVLQKGEISREEGKDKVEKSCEAITTDAGPPKKKRGRPFGSKNKPKDKPQSGMENQSIDNQSGSISKPKGKRGRPPGSKNKPKDKSHDVCKKIISDSESTATEAETSQDRVRVKKSKGRPPGSKNKRQSESEKSDKNCSDSETTTATETESEHGVRRHRRQTGDADLCSIPLSGLDDSFVDALLGFSSDEEVISQSKKDKSKQTKKSAKSVDVDAKPKKQRRKSQPSKSQTDSSAKASKTAEEQESTNVRSTKDRMSDVYEFAATDDTTDDNVQLDQLRKNRMKTVDVQEAVAEVMQDVLDNVENKAVASPEKDQAKTQNAGISEPDTIIISDSDNQIGNKDNSEAVVIESDLESEARLDLHLTGTESADSSPSHKGPALHVAEPPPTDYDPLQSNGNTTQPDLHSVSQVQEDQSQVSDVDKIVVIHDEVVTESRVECDPPPQVNDKNVHNGTDHEESVNKEQDLNTSETQDTITSQTSEIVVKSGDDAEKGNANIEKPAENVIDEESDETPKADSDDDLVFVKLTRKEDRIVEIDLCDSDDDKVGTEMNSKMPNVASCETEMQVKAHNKVKVCDSFDLEEELPPLPWAVSDASKTTSNLPEQAETTEQHARDDVESDGIDTEVGVNQVCETESSAASQQPVIHGDITGERPQEKEQTFEISSEGAVESETSAVIDKQVVQEEVAEEKVNDKTDEIAELSGDQSQEKFIQEIGEKEQTNDVSEEIDREQAEHIDTDHVQKQTIEDTIADEIAQIMEKGSEKPNEATHEKEHTSADIATERSPTSKDDLRKIKSPIPIEELKPVRVVVSPPERQEANKVLQKLRQMSSSKSQSESSKRSLHSTPPWYKGKKTALHGEKSRKSNDNSSILKTPPWLKPAGKTAASSGSDARSETGKQPSSAEVPLSDAEKENPSLVIRSMRKQLEDETRDSRKRTTSKSSSISSDFPGSLIPAAVDLPSGLDSSRSSRSHTPEHILTPGRDFSPESNTEPVLKPMRDRSGSPEQSTTPRQRSKSPTRKSVSPTKERSVSPIPPVPVENKGKSTKKSKTPRKKSKTPKKKSGSDTIQLRPVQVLPPVKSRGKKYYRYPIQSPVGGMVLAAIPYYKLKDLTIALTAKDKKKADLCYKKKNKPVKAAKTPVKAKKQKGALKKPRKRLQLSSLLSDSDITEDDEKEEDEGKVKKDVEKSKSKIVKQYVISSDSDSSLSSTDDDDTPLHLMKEKAKEKKKSWKTPSVQTSQKKIVDLTIGASSSIQPTKKDKSKEPSQEKRENKSQELPKRRNVIESDSESSDTTHDESEKDPRGKVDDVKSAKSDAKANETVRKSHDALKTLEVSDKRINIVTVQPVGESEDMVRTDKEERVRKDSGSEANIKTSKLEKARKESGETRTDKGERVRKDSGLEAKIKTSKLEKVRKKSGEKVSKSVDSADKRDSSFERKKQQSEIKEKRTPTKDKPHKQVIDLTGDRSHQSPKRKSEKDRRDSNLEMLRKLKLMKAKKLAAKASKSYSKDVSKVKVHSLTKSPHVAKDSTSEIKQQKLEKMKKKQEKRDKIIRKAMSVQVIIPREEKEIADKKLREIKEEEAKAKENKEKVNKMSQWAKDNMAKLKQQLKEKQEKQKIRNIPLPSESSGKEAELWQGLTAAPDLDKVMVNPYGSERKESGKQAVKRPAKEEVSTDPAKRAKLIASKSNRQTLEYMEPPPLGGFKIPKRSTNQPPEEQVRYIPGEKRQVRGSELREDQDRRDFLELLQSGEAQVVSDADSQEDIHREGGEGDKMSSETYDFIMKHPDMVQKVLQGQGKGKGGKGEDVTAKGKSAKEVTSQGPGGSGTKRDMMSEINARKSRLQVQEMYRRRGAGTRWTLTRTRGEQSSERGLERGPGHSQDTSRRAEVTMDTIEHVHCMIY